MEQELIHKELKKFFKMIDSFPTSDKVSKFYHLESILSPIEFNMFKDFFGEQEYTNALNLVLEAQEAIKICKIGELEKGYSRFQVVNDKAKLLSKKAEQYVKLYYLSGIAYYYFRKKDFKEAIKYTIQEIQETEKIENQGAVSLHYRRTGHLLNLIKIYKVTNCIKETIVFYKGSLNYLLNGNSSFIPFGNWNGELLNFIPYIRQRSLDIFFIDAVDMLIKNQVNQELKELILKELFMEMPDFEPQNNNQAMIYNWLYLQRLFYNNNYIEFVRDTIEFCQTPFDNSFDSLKLSLIANITHISQKCTDKSGFKKRFNHKVKDFIQTNLSSPDHLKDNVCNLF